MPPKKLTKEEREQIRKEEFERKADEEEQARKLAEQERLEREEAERKEAEERVKLRELELIRFDSETNISEQMLSKNGEMYDKIKSLEKEAYIWDTFLSCSNIPDLYSIRDINTYLTLWSEEESSSSFQDLTVKFGESMQFLEEIFDLEDSNLINADSAINYSSIKQRLVWLMFDKLNATTALLLRNSSLAIESTYGNLQAEAQYCGDGNTSLSISLWGNISLNHRITHINFNNHEFSIESHQRGLQLPNVALRVIHTYYDRLSTLCRTYSPRPVIKQSIPADETLQKKNSLDASKNQNISLNGSKQGSNSKLDSSDAKLANSKPQSAISVTSVRSGTNKNGSTARLQNEEVDTAANGDTENILDTINTCARAGEELLLEEFEIDCRQFSLLGSITYIDYIRFPPQFKNVGSWAIQEYENLTVKPLSYPVLQSGQDISQITPGSKLWPLINVSMSIPEHVLVSEDTLLARWDMDKLQWRTDGFSEVKLDVESKKISFKCQAFSPIALMQDSYLNMPYQGWSIDALVNGVVKLCITGNIHQIEINIEGEHCTLVRPDLPELRNTLGKPYKFLRFIKTLKSHGLTIFPEIDASNFVAVSHKDFQLEDSVYRDVSLLSNYKYSFKWSSWNASCSFENIVLRVSNAHSPSDWKLILVGPKSYKLSMTEDSDEFSLGILENEVTHSCLYHALVKDNIIENICISVINTGKTLQKLLLVTRPLVFT